MAGDEVDEMLRLTRIDGLLPSLYGHGPEPSDLLGQRDRLGDDTLPFLPDDPADQTHPLGLLGVDLASGEDHVHGDRFPYDLGQTLGTTGTGDDAEGDLGLTKDGCRRGEEDVAHHRQLATASELRMKRYALGSYTASQLKEGTRYSQRIR